MIRLYRPARGRYLFLLPALIGLILTPTGPAAAQWRPQQAPIMTRWAAGVTPDNAHREYPRPQLVRESWQCLNGLWEYAVTGRNDDRPDVWEGEILVPFGIESALSGVMRRLASQQRLWYRRSCTVPETWRSGRVRLHFGAVDWEAVVWVNGRRVGEHRGGYTPFSLDITAALQPGPEQEIVVAVWDPSSDGYQPRGKQVNEPRGIWYTPTTGIWRTAWLEPVPEIFIEDLVLTPDLDTGVLRLRVAAPGTGDGFSVSAVALAGERVAGRVSGRPGTELELPVGQVRTWSPDDPFLYDLQVTLLEHGAVADEVASYFGMRKISLGTDDAGITRMLLNDEFLFQIGPLDQGFWPDGLYTAPGDEALRYDVEMTKELGFNMARKHVKIEPDRWYYWCDRLGLLIWQDMPSGSNGLGRDEENRVPAEQARRQFELELGEMIAAYRNHPCIVVWVPINEGWGQYDTERITAWVKTRDPSRLVNNASGWTDFGTGDLNDIHRYPGPAAPPAEAARAIVLGEFGGLGYPVTGHLWQSERNWGYRNYQDADELTTAYELLLRRLHRLIGDPGLSAAVYTQTTDVEIEVNGLMTYDRALVKMDPERMAAAAARLYTPPPELVPVLPDSRTEAALWRYTFTAPPEDWYEPAFDDAAWSEGGAGFGRAGTPGAVIRTTWETDGIWVRRTFDLPRGSTDDLWLFIHHDEDAEVWINGIPAAELSGYTTSYVEEPIRAEALAALRRRDNVIAIHCRQTDGGQYLDAGLVRFVEGRMR